VWLPQLERAKERFAALIGAGVHEVTISHSISSALTSIASTFDYRARPKVVCAELDFPTIPYQWLVKQRDGVEVKFARSPDGIRIPIQAYEQLVDDRTALIATSHVFYATGAAQPISELAELAHAHGARLVVDGYHSVGVFPVNVRELDIDFYVGGVLKWLLGGPGLTFIYVREGLLSELQPTVSGWFASADQFAFDAQHHVLAPTADRLELGTPSVAAAYTGVAGMEMILEANPAAIADRIRALTGRVVERAEREGFEIKSPTAEAERTGIVMLALAHPQRTVTDLAARGFTVDYRPGLVRVSPHFYNTIEDVDLLMDAVTDIQASYA
jgi:selenocysteine lyase/cysteine desulfurase